MRLFSVLLLSACTSGSLGESSLVPIGGADPVPPVVDEPVDEPEGTTWEECFGDMAYVKRGAIPRQATVEAITDVIVAEFDPDSLAGASMNCRLQLAHALLDSLVERLSLANERLSRQ